MVKFTDGTFNCMAEREVTISCEWDADGGMAQGRNALPDDFDAATNLRITPTSSSARRSKDLRLLRFV